MQVEFFEEAVNGTIAVIGTLITVILDIHWLGLVTGLYILVQAVYLLRKWYREEKDWHKKRNPRSPS